MAIIVTELTSMNKTQKGDDDYNHDGNGDSPEVG